MFVKIFEGSCVSVTHCKSIQYVPVPIKEDISGTKGILVMDIDGDKKNLKSHDVTRKGQDDPNATLIYIMNDEGKTVDTI